MLFPFLIRFYLTFILSSSVEAVSEVSATYLSNTSDLTDSFLYFGPKHYNNITAMSTQITPPQGNGGSRESSEFEFVNVLNRSAPLVQPSNPLLLSSNQPAPGPGILLSPAMMKPLPPPTVSIQQPTPTQPVLASPPVPLPVSVPPAADQTRVSTVTAESPPTPGESP